MSGEQPPLWEFAEPPDSDEQPLTIQEKFEIFNRLNPWVYQQLAGMARELAMRGRRHLGIKMFIETLRFNYYRQTTDPNSVFKINNDYSSRYARLLTAQEPELAPLFELRRLRTP